MKKDKELGCTLALTQFIRKLSFTADRKKGVELLRKRQPILKLKNVEEEFEERKKELKEMIIL
jgi:hypothetical protein